MRNTNTYDKKMWPDKREKNPKDEFLFFNSKDANTRKKIEFKWMYLIIIYWYFFFKI